MAKRKEGVMPSPAPQGKKPSGTKITTVGVNWKARAASYERKVNALESRCSIDSGEIARLEKVIGDRDVTIERLTAGIDQYQKDITNYIERLSAGIDQYQKDIAVHVATADDRDTYINELKGKIRELEGEIEDAAQQYDKALNQKEAQNAAARIRYQTDGEYYRSQIEAYRRDVERIPRWLRRLFLSSHMKGGDQ